MTLEQRYRLALWLFCQHIFGVRVIYYIFTLAPFAVAGSVLPMVFSFHQPQPGTPQVLKPHEWNPAGSTMKSPGAPALSAFVGCFTVLCW